MKTVNAYYSHALYRYAVSKGLVLQEPSFARQTKRVKLEKQDQFWIYLQQQLGDTLGVYFGARLQPSDLGTFGHLLVSVDYLGDALKYLQRFYPLVGEGGDLTIAQAGNKVVIGYQPHYQQARGVRVEAVLSSIISMARQMTFEPISISWIELDYTPKADVLAALEGVGQCKVNCNQPQNAIVLPKSILSLPLHHANPAVAQSIVPVLSADLDALSQLSAKEKVQRLLQRQPYLNRKQVAERMHMSERSLGRALNKQDSDFAKEKRSILLKHANQALKNGLTVAEVAEQLRYSDASAFIKAYKNWTGKTPGQSEQSQINIK